MRLFETVPFEALPIPSQEHAADIVEQANSLGNYIEKIKALPESRNEIRNSIVRDAYVEMAKIKLIEAVMWANKAISRS